MAVDIMLYRRGQNQTRTPRLVYSELVSLAVVAVYMVGGLDRGGTSSAWVDWTTGTDPGSTAQAGRLDRATPRRRG